MGVYDGATALQRRARRVLQPVAKRMWTFQVTGMERLPACGPAILCANHVSFLDSAFLMLLVPRNISFVGKAEYMDSWKTKYFFPAMGMIPIDRAGGEKSQAAMDAAESVLRRGELFGIFPEGTRSRDGMLYKGKTGAARLAMKVGCPIFPVGIRGTREIQPPDARAPRLRGVVHIDIGAPVDPGRYSARRDDHDVCREMIDEVMFEIRSMTGQEYRNVYSVKSATAASPTGDSTRAAEPPLSVGGGGASVD